MKFLKNLRQIKEQAAEQKCKEMENVNPFLRAWNIEAVDYSLGSKTILGWNKFGPHEQELCFMDGEADIHVDSETCYVTMSNKSCSLIILGGKSGRLTVYLNRERNLNYVEMVLKALAEQDFEEIWEM